LRGFAAVFGVVHEVVLIAVAVQVELLEGLFGLGGGRLEVAQEVLEGG